MAATSADVARHAGLSRSTVSQVLNGHTDQFTAATTERVLQSAKTLGYQPSAVGRMLRNGTSDFVIALVPNTTFGGNLQDVFDVTTSLLAEKGLTLVLRLSTQSPASLDRILASMLPRAVLSLQPFTQEERRILADRGTPGFDTSDGVDLNDEIGRLQAEHLISRGYRKLAFAHLKDDRDDPYGAGRETAVRNACERAGLEPPRILSLGINLADATRALETIEPGYGIVCYNDDVAITLLTAIGNRRWTVPSDIGLIGMDNTPLSQVTNPRLTTVGYDLPAVARASAASALFALGEGPEPDYPEINLRVFPGESA